MILDQDDFELTKRQKMFSAFQNVIEQW